jgi:septal ring factor EnvC (AmiA/AmiB activator)
MRYLLLFACLLTAQGLLAQTPAPVMPDLQKATLGERYQYMKVRSSTYNEHKVIKENVLDGVWKVAMDSMNARKAQARELSSTIARLEGELKSTNETLAKKEASAQELVYASTHISALGINFEKGTFLVIFTVITGVLVVLLVLLSGKMKLMQSNVRENVDKVNATLVELEEYKRKSLDKQTKLSRELQNERNKLTELRRL